MPAVILMGTQWGDEGKGKIVDFLAREADMVVRYQGGANAGHTVVTGGKEYKLHQVPSGIIFGRTSVIGSGVVLDPGRLAQEIDTLKSQGIGVDDLHISDRAQIVLPVHLRMDNLEEKIRGKSHIGTTGRGIGPTYWGKIARNGLRVTDLLSDRFPERLAQSLQFTNRILGALGEEPEDPDRLYEQLKEQAEFLAPYVADTMPLINSALDRGDRVLFEGAQGTLLDVDHGTYPYVTSSNTVAGGACTGAGIGPTRVSAVIGVVKAYTSRVGIGPFPTELEGDLAHQLREKAWEYGTTTGRPRRVGWLDAVAVRYACRINDLSGLALTRLDTISGFRPLKIADSYRNLASFPADNGILDSVEPSYLEMDGWDEDITGARQWDDLPPQARRYVEAIEDLTGVPVTMISVGQDRDATILRTPIFPGK